MKIPERNNQLKKGLYELIVYINQYYDTQKLSIVEIGSWTGISAEIFVQYFNLVYCVDPWSPTAGINTKYNMHEVENIFDNRMKKYKNYQKLKMLSKDAVKLIDKIDLVYIDGLHTYKAVKEDITLWKNRCNFFIAGHDYWPKKFPGVIKAVNELLGKPDKIFSDTSWIKNLTKKNNNDMNKLGRG